MRTRCEYPIIVNGRFEFCQNPDGGKPACPEHLDKQPVGNPVKPHPSNRDDCGGDCGVCDVCQAGVSEPVSGLCLSCGAVEVYLNRATGTRNLSGMGESANYPTGHGCEVCA